jgi:hypothetical protein
MAIVVEEREDPAPTSRSRASERVARVWRHPAFRVGALFVFTTIVMYRPNPRSWGDFLYANVGDPSFTSWVMLWDAHALHTDPIHLFTAPIYWPYHLTLAYSENLLPLVPFFTVLRLVTGNVVLSMNLLVLGLSIFTQVMTYLLARRLTGRRDVAIFSAVAYSFSGYAFIHLGHVQLLTLGMFPLCFLLLFRLLEERRIWLGVAFGIASGCLFESALYYGAVYIVCVPVIVLGHLLFTRFRPGRGFIPSLLVGGVCAAAIIVPLSYPYWRVADDFAVRELVDAYDLKASDLISPGPNTYLYSGLASAAEKRGDPAEHAFFLGFSTLLLAAVGAFAAIVAGVRRRSSSSEQAVGDQSSEIRRRRELFLLCCAGVTSIALAAGGTVFGHQGPFYYFHDYVPGFSGIRAVARLAVPALLTITVLAAVGLAALTRSMRRVPAMIAVGVAVAVVLAELTVSPVPKQQLDLSASTLAVYRQLAHEPSGAVLELPVVDVSTSGGRKWALVEGPRLIYGSYDWHPRFNGYSGYWPPDYVAKTQTFNTFPSPEALDLARQLGVRYVILHVGATYGYDQLSEEQARTIIDHLPPTAHAARYGNSWLVDLGPP